MPKILREHPWKISYSSNTHNTIADFYIPALECAVQYDRKAGFFSSAILSKVARGLGAMLHSGGRMRLIMGCQFSPQDLQAIQQGYELRDALLSRLDAELKPPENFAQLKHFEILSWLIQNNYLDIKIAIPIKENGIPESSDKQLDPQHIFHEKVGIFTDSNNDRLAFNGSNNESIGGWELNVESFHVYCSWEGGRELDRVEEEISRFEQLWYDIAPNVRVFEVPEAVQKKLLRYAPINKPAWNPQIEFDTQPIDNVDGSQLTVHSQQSLLNSHHSTVITQQSSLNSHHSTVITQQSAVISEQERFAFLQLANISEHPGCLDFCLKSIAIKPWPHQIKILRRVAETFPQSFLIADEVGLGKTIETGLILRYLLLAKKVKRVLILAPASVQPQWLEELREKFNLFFWSYTQNSFTVHCSLLSEKYRQQSTINNQQSTNPWNTCDLILASSHLVRRTERMHQLLEAEPWDLVILDEAHHARRKSPQDRKETPNRLLELMGQLKEKTKSLILLSATPMQIDAIEVFDLLHLLGLQGHWSYGDNFCNYFASLQGNVKRETLDFWQIMCSDYFGRGGQPCSRLQQYLQKDRILAYKLQDIWQRGKKISNHKQLLADRAFIDTSRQYLTANTPLKDLMFRHTRDTLKQYFRIGLLERDIPNRVVQDNAITLEPHREVPLYQAVSDYVRHFYRLAQKDQRSCLGFLMTLYRKRLTSSFYAIKSSLQRRLDFLLTQQESVLSNDDLADLDDADDAVITGLESFFEPVDPQEIQYLEDLLRQFDNTGEDTKLSQFIKILRQELIERESAIAFTQYTDTMDYLRSTLQLLYGSQVACYSGRGGELYQNGEWCIVPKEEIKRRFRQDEIKILLCTESASEGLNLQNCGVLINYDMPWNPMRVEQRIGRIDRIGQRYSTVRIHNFYYDGTVEAKVYRKLRLRINAFATVVGNLQPILASVPTFIEQAAMSADPEEEDVLMSEFDSVIDAPPLRLAIEEIISMDLDADLAEIQKLIHPTPFTPEDIERLFTTSAILKTCGVKFDKRSDSFTAVQSADRVWELAHKGQKCSITFYPDVFDEMPSLRLMTFGDPLFEELLHIAG
ncbi:helicase-related protein [Iningainema tapete]|uniref:DEAD/DEAH box helicase family protein n=1 Tax=Iningainema tapete BLCC-T55 TaxID=2748662 RepID=A0A8J7C6P7_9CYAN|nr:helicase-related protein [Iningainema tapete]MBD2772261.1 DEAD/DEAH box helicase family protein [Iningainema tapete BLCC-T55]